MPINRSVSQVQCQGALSVGLLVFQLRDALMSAFLNHRNRSSKGLLMLLFQATKGNTDPLESRRHHQGTSP